MKPSTFSNPLLDKFKKIVRREIQNQYRSTEEFCYVNDIGKAILSRFISDKQKDFNFSTITKIAKALDIEIVFKSNS
ncbi:MAG: hypothetical protein OXB84_07870 [Halobacteriovoraceae bacterium]|nr:hypothetical protein [Halobacteriovoraceae bacterium]